MKGVIHPVDVYVGSRLRRKRLELGVSQEEIGAAVNITFQQIQKYEKGYNRISCSKLLEMAQFLKTKVGYFFEGLPYKASYNSSSTSYEFPMEATSSLSDVALYNPYDDSWHSDPDIRQLVEAFIAIKDRQVRATIISLVRSFVKK